MKHIGFIMDGNRRWAKNISNLANYGHEKGGDTIERVLEMCLSAKLQYVSMWALSKENILQRSKTEIQGIFNLIQSRLPRLIPKLKDRGIRFEIIGDLWLLPLEIRSVLFDAVEKSREGCDMTFILAIGYSGQDEIVRGIRRCLAEKVDPATLSEEGFSQYLDSGKYPPPDMIVRTGGNVRHSGFFLYQSAYSEYYFTDTLWPDFGEPDFYKALEFYSKAERKFGK